MNIVKAWITDYLQMAKGHVVSYLYRNPPTQYKQHVIEGKNPIVFIPGFFERWGFFKVIADQLSHAGHPIYIVSELGNNLHSIAEAAAIVKKIIDKEQLTNVVLIGHSKGGLIGKYILSYLNVDNRVVRLIAIATPFSGSSFASYVPIRAFRDVQIDAPLLKQLGENTSVNSTIVSITPTYDNHIVSPKGNYLDGAINITLSVKGHHAIIFDPQLIDVVLQYV